MSTRIWYLPADDFTSFINDLENDANAKQFDIKIIDQATIVYIQTKEDKIHVGFSTFIDDFPKFMEFPGRVYNSKERKNYNGQRQHGESDQFMQRLRISSWNKRIIFETFIWILNFKKIKFKKIKF